MSVCICTAASFAVAATFATRIALPLYVFKDLFLPEMVCTAR